MVSNKSIAFRVNYLLGVKTSILLKDFVLEYNLSHDLNVFSSYSDAVLLRNLCILRHYLLSIFPNYFEKEGKCCLSKSIPAISSEVSYLSLKGIDISLVSKCLGIVDTINLLSKMINTLVLHVLTELSIPFPEEIKEFFNIPVLNKRMLYTYTDDFYNLNNPFDVYIYKGKHIKRSLKYILKDDYNLVISAFSINDKCFKGQSIPPVKPFKLVSKDIGSVSPFDFEELLLDVQDSKIVSLNKLPISVDKYVGKTQMEDSCPSFVSVPSLNNNILDFLKKGKISIYVDCDNIDFFTLLVFLKSVEHQKTITNIVLIVDEKSNYFWKIFDKIYAGYLNVTMVSVPRLKEQKSVADIVLTKELCCSVYKDGLEKVILVSSDSDFFGLVSGLPSVEFCVCYCKSSVSESYIDFLSALNVLTYDIYDFVSNDVMSIYKDKCLTYLLLYGLCQIPISRWSICRLIEYIAISFTQDTRIKLNREEIRKKVTSLYDTIHFKIDGDSIFISVGDIILRVE